MGKITVNLLSNLICPSICLVVAGTLGDAPGKLENSTSIQLNDHKNNSAGVPPPLPAPKLLHALNGHTDTVTSVAFSPDSKTLATASRDNTIRLWDARAGTNKVVLRGHTAPGNGVCAVAFSPDGKTLASSSYDKTVMLWHLATGRRTATLSGQQGAVLSVAFSPDGTALASCSAGEDWGEVWLWDFATGKSTAVLRHAWTVGSVAFSPDGRKLASTGSDGIRIWDLKSSKQWAMTPTTGFYCAVYSPNGRTLAAGRSDGTIVLWEVASLTERAVFRHAKYEIRSLAFSPDGRTLVSGGNDKSIKLWSVQTGKNLLTFEAAKLSVSSVAFSPDGKLIVSGGWDKTVKVWNVADCD